RCSPASAYVYFFHSSASRPPPALHSFPTRRSSDLCGAPAPRSRPRPARDRARRSRTRFAEDGIMSDPADDDIKKLTEISAELPRSEEHTSELQSRSDLVCRLLLEKKKIERYRIQAN